MWFVMQDDEGPFLTNETPSGTDVILFHGNIVEAEIALQRACNDWESELDEDEEMNEGVQ